MISLFHSNVKDQNDLLYQLNKINTHASSEKGMDLLLTTVVEECMKITGSDRGLIYIKEKNKKTECLRFRLSRNNSNLSPLEDFSLPLSNESIAGSSALTGKSYIFQNIEEIPPTLGRNYIYEFDKKYNYKTVNMLVIPMKNLKKEVIGVLQLLNKKKDYKTPLSNLDDFKIGTTSFTKEDETIISSLALQAAILLERNQLYEEIQYLFKTFTESLVTTIDQRDPATAGHSIRVAKYSLQFAKAINNVSYGKYGYLTFSKQEMNEIYYAGLLHDIGKIGIRESILLKQKKISEEGLEVIKYRFYYLKKDLELKKVKHIISKQELLLITKLDSYYQFIKHINNKNHVSKDEIKTIEEISKIPFVDIDGVHKMLLSPSEKEQLIVEIGNLSESEKLLIENHPIYTYRILKSISWGKDLNNVPKFAACHHEKLNGSGYPLGIVSQHIPIPSRILTIVDIFEALTAKDRPYKSPLSIEKALDILKKEVLLKHLDGDLVEIFINEKVYELDI